MTLVDFILIFILAFITAAGFFFGLIRVLGALATIIVSIVVAGIFFGRVSEVIQPYTLNNKNLARVAGFLLIYWLTSLFLSFVVGIANHLFNLPLLKTVNRMLGALVSLIGASLVLSVFFYLINSYALTEALRQLLQQSVLIRMFIMIGSYARWIIPGL